MPNLITTLFFTILGACLGNWAVKRDTIGIGLGIALGLGPAFAIANQTPVFYLPILVFLPLLFWRRHIVLRQNPSV